VPKIYVYCTFHFKGYFTGVKDASIHGLILAGSPPYHLPLMHALMTRFIAPPSVVAIVVTVVIWTYEAHIWGSTVLKSPILLPNRSPPSLTPVLESLIPFRIGNILYAWSDSPSMGPISIDTDILISYTPCLHQAIEPNV
jgi:hypothetical protein